MYVLLSSEYIYGDNGIRFIFMEVNTGKLFKIEDKTNINPFFYTTVQVEDLLLDEMMIFEGYVKNGKFNSSRIMSTETVQKIDPFTRKEIPVTKINLASTYLLDIKRKKYNALQKVLPSHTIHNDNVKYVDQFTMMQGYIMGMNYDITMNGLEMIEPEEIFYHESFDSYSKELVDWAGLRLFASIPKISHNILAIDIEVDIPQRRNPDPYQVEFPISSIAIVSKRERIVFVLTDELRETKPTDWDSYDWKEDDIIKIHDNEKEMIEEAVRYILDSPETMVMGYNIDDFDFPYLLTRAELFGLKYEHIWGRTEQIYNVWTQKTESRTIKGITNKTSS
jgi:DNA polymerase elongation subunit (family B)